MKRLLALAPAALLLAACGDTCSSKSAKLADNPLPSTCTLPTSSSATIEVQLCSECTDSSPGCQAEFVTDHFEVAPTFQECQASQGCPINSSVCGIDNSRVTCTVTTPAAAGTYPIQAESVTIGSATVQSGATASCHL